VNAAFLFLTLLQTSTETWVNTPRPLRVDSQVLDVRNAAIYKSATAQLIRETIGIEPRDLTFVIQVVRFSDGAEVVKQNWYVYHSGPWSDAQFETQRRIYGRKQIWFLYIQLNARSALTTTYVIETKKKSAAYFDHLQQTAGLFGVSLPTVGEVRNVWNAKLVDIPYVPCDLVIEGVTFDNEGLSWVDFSAAVPLKQPGVFAVVDLYVRPTDIKGLGFGSWPHAVEGVLVGSRPLKNILLGVGWGPVYGGVVVGGGTYSYSFGLNISAQAALKK
jgi:hypothetical protein